MRRAAHAKMGGSSEKQGKQTIGAFTHAMAGAFAGGVSRVVVAPLKAKEAEPGDAVEEISTAMADARVCEESGLSPGAGLADADAQADAAFADMINTTIDVTGEALDSEELSRLSRAGRMDEESKSKKSGGILGDVKDLFGALSKGAHIVKQKGGRV